MVTFDSIAAKLTSPTKHSDVNVTNQAASAEVASEYGGRNGVFHYNRLLRNEVYHNFGNVEFGVPFEDTRNNSDRVELFRTVLVG